MHHLGPAVYAYAGPSRIRDEAVRPGGRGAPVTSPEDLLRWLDACEDADERGEPFTFVVDLNGTLLLAPRRSEHVACAGGESVLAAGEIMFDGPMVVAVTNQSTGYRPDPSCWPAVAFALDRAGLPHPGGFTSAFLFRECRDCGELNVVKDGFFVCALCDADLPRDLPRALPNGLTRGIRPDHPRDPDRDPS